MADSENLIEIMINGSSLKVKQGTTVAAAISLSGSKTIRQAVNGSKRGALCGMGICYECRATVDGMEHIRTCMMPCRPGMEVHHV